jgi:hypothetical protein
MDVAWQESAGSFLDSSGTGPSSFASFVGGDGALWSSSSDSPVFSGQPVLWESGADTPADSHISGLTLDSGSGTDTSPLLAGGWIADGASGLASGMLDGSVLWSGAGSNTSSSLTNGSGVGLGALDLGAGSSTPLWQQFVDSFGSQFATWAADAPHLLWTGASSQPAVTVPVPDNSQSVHLAASDSVSLPAVGTVSPTQLLWTPPSGATGLATGPTLTDAAPTPVMTGAGAIGSSSSNPPITGVGSHS